MSPCDLNGVNVGYRIVPGEPTTVIGLRVTGIALGACRRQRLHYAVANAVDGNLRTGSAVITARELTLTFATPVEAALIDDVVITIVG